MNTALQIQHPRAALYQTSRRKWDCNCLVSNDALRSSPALLLGHGGLGAAVAHKVCGLEKALLQTRAQFFIDTGIAQRDEHLRSPDFFAAATHPLITFRSTGITDAGGGVYQVAGKLAIMGKTHDLVLPLTLAGVKDHPTTPGKQVAGFNGRLSVDRLALGVGDGKFYKMGLLG